MAIMKKFIFEGCEMNGLIVGKVRPREEKTHSEQPISQNQLTDFELRSMILGSFEDFKEVRQTAFEMVGMKQDLPTKEKAEDSDHDTIMGMSLK